jgi:VanZ family protein
MTEIIKTFPFSIAVTVAIWVLCLIPIPETPLSDISLIDKWTHFVMYGVLTLVMLWERGKNPMKPMISVWQLLLIPIVMGGLIELAQRYLTTCRSGEWLDFVGDTIGVVIGAILYVAFHAAKDHSPRM